MTPFALPRGVWIAALVGALVSGGGAAYWLTRPAARAATVETVTAREFVLRIKGVGDLIPRQRHMIAADFSGKLDFLALEGKEVKKGEVVARLSTQTIEESLQEEALKRDMLSKDFETTRLTAERDRKKVLTERRGAEAALALARLELKQLRAGTPAAEVAELRLKAEAARRTFDNTRAEHTAREALLEKGIIRPKELAEHRVELLKAQKAHEVAKTQLEIAENGYPDSTIEAKQLEVKKAENALAILKGKLANLDRIRRMQEGIAQADLDDAEARVRQLERRMAASGLKAPAAGVVVLPTVWMNGNPKKVQVGDEVRRNSAFMEVADVSAVLIRMDIPETEIGRVKVGMPVEIRVESLGKTFPGTLEHLGVLATEKKDLVNYDGAPKVFEALIRTDARSEAFRPGMTVDVSVVAETLAGVLTVPHTALHTAHGETFVYLQGTPPIRREVEVGLADSERAVIKSGLVAGDVVLLEKPE